MMGEKRGSGEKDAGIFETSNEETEQAAPVGIPPDQISGRGRWCLSGPPSLTPE